MQITLQETDFLVLDDFLDEQQFGFMWNFIQEEQFRLVHEGRWIKAFRLSDGQPLWGDVYTSRPAITDVTSLSTPYPSGRGIDTLIYAILQNTELFAKYIGLKDEDWDYFFCRPYLYPVGTGLSWHTDGRGDVCGAYVYYAHLEWNAHWGAELLIDSSGQRDLDYPVSDMYDGSKRKLGLHLDWQLASDAAMRQGMGHYVMPRPNRFVLLRPGLLHRINPVQQSAGDHIRASVTGFFLRDLED
jgi:hypothetical protein